MLPPVARLCLSLALITSSVALVRAADSPFSDQQRAHWAYQPVMDCPIPDVAGDPGCQTPVDAFMVARLREHGLTLAEQADRRTFIRRATFTLHGLPPTPEQIADYLADERPDATKRLIDRLLESPRYGERWARHWLDLVRYAESDGYKSDALRADAWRYRDYVIRSLNEDKPYDHFVAEQLAGDELYPDRGEALVATGFLRHWPYEDNGRDLDRQWAAILDDVTETTGTVLLGITIGCARCHDHKYDAILQADFYRLQAFFAAMTPHDTLPAIADGNARDYFARQTQWEEATGLLRQQRDELERPFEQDIQQGMGGMFPDFVKEILAKDDSSRSPYERQLVILAGNMLQVDRQKMSGQMPAEVKEQWEDLNRQIAAFDQLKPPAAPTARGVRDIGHEAPPTIIPEYEEQVEPGFLSVLDADPAEIEPPPAGNQHSTGRRATLARWITSRDNPLTARVMVNRIWQYHFGRGLVASSGDFGVQGDRPTHPQLLDYLARQFMDRGWSIKEMHRLIMNSAVYQQSAIPAAGARGFEVDPENHLLWRMPLRRVEAEVLRDSLLLVSGQLNLQMYGPSVFPELPQNLSGRYGWDATPGDQQYRRSIYLVVKRNAHLPLLKTFDVPDSHSVCTRRDRTTTPSQALILLNNDWPLERAQAFAARLIDQAGTDSTKIVCAAYEIAFGRVPRDVEVDAGCRFLQQQTTLARQRHDSGGKLLLPPSLPDGFDAPLASAVVDYCHALCNTNEFLYVD